jgi:hypothetical protein
MLKKFENKGLRKVIIKLRAVFLDLVSGLHMRRSEKYDKK